MNRWSPDLQVNVTEDNQTTATPEQCIELIRWFSRIVSDDERATVISSARYFARKGRIR